MAELALQYSQHSLEAGCDEAGRGCLAGPVVAAAVILPQNFSHSLLNDSKKVNKNNRELLKEIIEKEAVAYAIGICSPEEIDEINILNASILAMHKALSALKTTPEFIAVDGNRFKVYQSIPHVCVVKGDSKLSNIAAASILAKTYRDDIMQKLHNLHPEYAWNQNMGYPTVNHRKAIREFGATEFHRKTFRLLNEQLELF